MWKTNYGKYARIALLLMLLLFFTILMFNISLQYFPIRKDVAFLQIKQWVFRSYNSIVSNIWFTAFYIHVITSSFCLLAGFTQFFRNTLPNGLHRKFGKFYIVVVLFFAAPSGLIMSFFANGGPWSITAFLSLSLLWIFSTLMGFISARRKKFTVHGSWMIISYALALSALTLRAWKWSIVNLTDLNLKPMDLYRLVAWLGWVPNLIVALLLIKWRVHQKLFAAKKAFHAEKY